MSYEVWWIICIFGWKLELQLIWLGWNAPAGAAVQSPTILYFIFILLLWSNLQISKQYGQMIYKAYTELGAVFSCERPECSWLGRLWYSTVLYTSMRYRDINEIVLSAWKSNNSVSKSMTCMCLIALKWPSFWLGTYMGDYTACSPLLLLSGRYYRFLWDVPEHCIFIQRSASWLLWLADQFDSSCKMKLVGTQAFCMLDC